MVIREVNIWVYVIMFMIYSTAGAVIEHLLYFFSDKRKAITNPILIGFPIYGIGAYLVVWINRLLAESRDEGIMGIKDSGDSSEETSLEIDNLVIEFMIYGLTLSAIEYAAGIFVGAGKNSYVDCGFVHSWDYSNQRFNLDGMVSLRNFVVFGLFGLLVTRLHPRIIEHVNKIFED